MRESQASTALECPVSAYNEWDPLEEVIVGIVDSAHFPPWHVAVGAPLTAGAAAVFREHAGQPFPANEVAAARDELDQLVDILSGEGVKVRRPEARDHGHPSVRPAGTSTGLLRRDAPGPAAGDR